jgi:class 3 adenylate cyclase
VIILWVRAAVVEILSRYFSEMTEIIFRYEGTFNKNIGDAIRHFWGLRFLLKKRMKNLREPALHNAD